jgi:hypothetical protein
MPRRVSAVRLAKKRAGYIYQMMNKHVQVSLIQKCILADHLNVWKDFNTLLLSTGEWDMAAEQLDQLIN